MKKTSKKRELMDRLIKQEVVKTVLELIQEDRQVTMDEVALRCGVAKGTLYNYFKNKKALILYVHEYMLIPLKETFEKLFESPISPRKKLYSFVDDVLNFQKQFPLYFSFIQSQRSAAEANNERITLTILPLVKICKEGITKGEFVDVDPYVLAAMIFGTVIGPMESLKTREDVVQDLDSLKKDIICLLDRIILKEQEKLS